MRPLAAVGGRRRGGLLLLPPCRAPCDAAWDGAVAGAVPDCSDAAHTPHSPRATGLPTAALRSLTADRRGRDARSALGRSFGAWRRARRIAIRVAQLRSPSGELARDVRRGTGGPACRPHPGATELRRGALPIPGGPDRIASSATTLPATVVPDSHADQIEYAGRHGFNFVGLGPAAAVREHTDACKRAWGAHRHDPDRLNGHVATPKIGILRLVVVADRDTDAEAAARSAHQVWFRSITQLWHEHGDHSIDGLFSWETAIQHKSIIFGSPDRVRGEMQRVATESGCNYVICSFAWGTLSREQSMRSLDLFASDVMPAFATG